MGRGPWAEKQSEKQSEKRSEKQSEKQSETWKSGKNMGRAYAVDASGATFSTWQPAEKFKYVLKERHFSIFRMAEQEWGFDPVRRWRWDFAWPTQLVAVEVDGFGFGHQAQQQMQNDNEKANRGVELGWRVFRYNTRQLGAIKGVRAAVDQVCAFLCEAE